MRALEQMHRVLKTGGIGFLALPPRVFKDEPGKFEKMCDVLERYFGWTVIKEHSGRIVSVDQPDEEVFESYVFTLQKTGAPQTDAMTFEDWKTLEFTKKKTSNGNGNGNGHAKPAPGTKPPPEGAFHAQFQIGGDTVSFTPRGSKKREEEYKKNKKEYGRAVSAIEALVQEYGKIKNIPPEKLLSISLEELPEESQRNRDAYFRALLQTYGCVENVPVDELNANSSVILVRRNIAKRGWVLCLGDPSDNKKKRGWGKVYFNEQEFES